MKWAAFMMTLAVALALSVPGVFIWVGWLAFHNAKISGVEIVPAIIFTAMSVVALIVIMQLVDVGNDWVAQRGAVNIAKTQGEMAGGIKELSNLQRSQAGALAATLRAMNAAQGNNGPVPVPGGLDFDEG